MTVTVNGKDYIPKKLTRYHIREIYKKGVDIFDISKEGFDENEFLRKSVDVILDVCYPEDAEVFDKAEIKEVILLTKSIINETFEDKAGDEEKNL